MSGKIWWCDGCGHAQTDRYGSICVQCGYAPNDLVYPYLLKSLAERKASGDKFPWNAEYISEIEKRIQIYEERRLVKDAVNDAEAAYLAALAPAQKAKEEADKALAKLNEAKEEFKVADKLRLEAKRLADDAWSILLEKAFPAHRQSILRSQQEYTLNRVVYARVQSYRQKLVDGIQKEGENG